MTLLELYIEDRKKIYREPERRGTQKGHEIGMFLGRFTALINSLYDHNQKEIAERSNISYAFLRKIRTESVYKKAMEMFYDVFANEYVIFYILIGMISKVRRSNSVNPDDDYIEFPYDLESSFRDVSSYSHGLKTVIAGAIVHHLETEGIDLWLGFYDKLIYMLSKWNAPELNKKIFLTVTSLGTEIISNTLINEQVSEEQRKKAAECILFIKELSATL